MRNPTLFKIVQMVSFELKLVCASGMALQIHFFTILVIFYHRLEAFLFNIIFSMEDKSAIDEEAQ